MISILITLCALTLGGIVVLKYVDKKQAAQTERDAIIEAARSRAEDRFRRSRLEGRHE